MSLARRFGDKYGTKINGYCNKNKNKRCKNCLRVVQKTAWATGDLIRNKTADKITSLGKTKGKEKEDGRQEIYIPPQKRQQIIDDLRLF